MTTWDGATIGLATGNDSGRTEFTGATWNSQGVNVFQSSLPINVFDPAARALLPASSIYAGRMDTTGSSWPSALLPLLSAVLNGRREYSGDVWVARFLPLSVVYRTTDRITLAGFALDLAGRPLRSVQLQFIGETVQDHYFGAGANLDGIYVAYLETGDTYDAFAFHPTTGITYKLERMDESPNQTNLVFRQVTKRGGFGEGIFLNGG